MLTALSPTQGHTALSIFSRPLSQLLFVFRGGFWDSGSLVLSRLCPNSIWGPSPPSCPAIHTSFLSFFIPSSLADRLLSHMGLVSSCPCVSTSDPWDLLAFVFVCPVGLSLRLCLVLPPPSRPFSLFSKSSVGHSLLSPFDLLALLCRQE